jgi:hypothetical protein
MGIKKPFLHIRIHTKKVPEYSWIFIEMSLMIGGSSKKGCPACY